jgi:hypothetical protein
MASSGTGDGIGAWLGRRADRPAVAAALVGASAVVFDVLWSAAFLALVSTEPYVLPNVVSLRPVSALGVGNAIVVTATVWTVAVARSDAPLTAKRGLLVGGGIGIVSYLTLGAVLAVSILVRRGQFEGPIHALSLAVGYGLAALVFTLGIPVALSAGIGWYLGRTRERTI